MTSPLLTRRQAWAALLLGLPMGILTLWGAWQDYQWWQLRRHGVNATAIVISCDDRRNPDDSYDKLVVYEYRPGGDKLPIRAETWLRDVVAPGEPLPIRHLPSDPAHIEPVARLHPSFPYLLLRVVGLAVGAPIGILLLGGGLFAGTWLCRPGSRPNPTAPQA